MKFAGGLVKGLLKKTVTALIGIIGPLAFFLGIIIVLALILFMGIYWGMSEESILTDAVAQAQDVEVEKYATNRADKSNVFNTWVVPGEGSWHERRVANENKNELFTKYQGGYTPSYQYNDSGDLTVGGLGYNGEDMPGWTLLGRLVDNEGKDQKFKNYWGDVYAPILFDSLRFNDDNLMGNEDFRNRGLNDSGFNLKPYFYYKPSTITTTSTDSEGETHTTVTHIFLLVEVYSVRGHIQYHYEWITETSENSSTTKEVLRDTDTIDNGKKYLTSFLEEHLELEPADKEIMVDSIFEAMQGFTAKKEWMQWLADNSINQNALISGASIPPEYFNMLKEASVATGIPVHILTAIILKESAWNPLAVNESTGCFGLTQLDPTYWVDRATRYGFNPVTDQWNPRAQIMIGAMVLRDLIGFNNMPDWDSRNWDKNPAFRAAMASYGGYGNNVDKAHAYIDDIVSKAKAYVAPAVFPVIGYSLANISSPFGYRASGFHGAIDIACPTGSQVVSASAGIVTQSGWHSGYGNYIVITDANYDYFYAHLSKRDAQVNQLITPGTDIGLVGDTGSYSQGAHLHFSISVIGGNPMTYVGAINPVTILQCQ